MAQMPKGTLWKELLRCNLGKPQSQGKATQSSGAAAGFPLCKDCFHKFCRIDACVGEMFGSRHTSILLPVELVHIISQTRIPPLQSPPVLSCHLSGDEMISWQIVKKVCSFFDCTSKQSLVGECFPEKEPLCNAQPCRCLEHPAVLWLFTEAPGVMPELELCFDQDRRVLRKDVGQPDKVVFGVS